MMIDKPKLTLYLFYYKRIYYIKMNLNFHYIEGLIIITNFKFKYTYKYLYRYNKSIY